MSIEEALETTRIHGVTGTLDGCQGLMGTRLVRTPHHTIRDAGRIGGGAGHSAKTPERGDPIPHTGQELLVLRVS